MDLHCEYSAALRVLVLAGAQIDRNFNLIFIRR